MLFIGKEVKDGGEEERENNRCGGATASVSTVSRICKY
tara:strand:- start:439 stop:552 length:114 start_codon:yes stop_codon:yes gene_type:complete